MQKKEYWVKKMNEISNYNFLKGFENKIVIVPDQYVQWKEEREKYLYKGEIPENSKQRSILPNEIIIEFDFKKETPIDSKEYNTAKQEAKEGIQKIKDFLIKQKCYFWITNHKGKSPHIRLLIEGLENYTHNIRKEYKKTFIKQIIDSNLIYQNNILLDKGLITSNNKLIPLENKPHWKPKYNGNIVEVIFENNEGQKPKVNEEIIKEIEERFKEYETTVQNIPQGNYDINITGLKEFWKKHYKKPNRNTLCLAFGGMCVKCGIDIQKAEQTLKELIGEGKDFEERKKGLKYNYAKKPEELSVSGKLYETFNDLDKEEQKAEFKTFMQQFKKKEEIDAIVTSAHNYKEIQEQNKNTENNEALTFLAMRNRNDATENIVQEILTENKIFTIRDDQTTEMWIYKNGIYKPEAKTYIQEHTRNKLQKAFTTQICTEITNKIQADTYIEQDEFFNQQNKYKNLIAVQNGILNIETKKITPFTPNLYFFNKINAEYKPEQDCPNIKKFFSEVLENEDDIKTIQELVGYCLLKEYRYEKAFMFNGTGRNGKSKTLDLIKRFLGQENCSSISLTTIEKDQYALAHFHNKLINLSGDLSKQALTNTGNFKTLTGRDLITSNRKYKNMLTFENYAKLVFATNELPKSKDMSDGFWLRWILINFPFKFLPKKDLEDLPEQERRNIKIQNPKIIEQITTIEELNGFLNWALEGLQRLQTKKDFSYTKTMRKTKETWIRTSDSLKAFIMDNIEEDYESMIEKKKFKEIYNMYCKKHKVNPENDKSINEVLTKDYGVTSERPSIEYKQYRVWSGIKFSQGSQDSHGFSTLLGT